LDDARAAVKELISAGLKVLVDPDSESVRRQVIARDLRSVLGKVTAILGVVSA
jgi:hypothetical protein